MGETSQVVTGLLADTGSLALGTQGSFPGIAVMHEWFHLYLCRFPLSRILAFLLYTVPATVLRLVTTCVFSSTLIKHTWGASLSGFSGAVLCHWLNPSLDWIALLSCSLWCKFSISGQPDTKFMWKVNLLVFHHLGNCTGEYPHGRGVALDFYYSFSFTIWLWEPRTTCCMFESPVLCKFVKFCWGIFHVDHCCFWLHLGCHV